MRQNKNPHPRHNHSLATGYFVAVIFLIVGITLMLKNFNIIDSVICYSIVSWQMLLIAMGFFNIGRKQYVSGSIILATGVYFLLPKLGWIDHSVLNFWPIVFIMVGIVSIIQLNKKKKSSQHPHRHFTTEYNTTTDGYINSDISFSSVKHVVTDEVFKGGIVKNRFGATIIDLRRCRLEGERTILDIECTMGGIELYIPSSWNVKTEIVPFLGGCEDSRISSPVTDYEHTLVLTGSVTMAGVDIKS